MQTQVTPTTLAKLPLHDADFLSLAILPLESGDISLNLEVEIHPDEPLDDLLSLGIQGRRFCLTFAKCWRITSNLYGVASSRETVDTLDRISDSNLIKELLGAGLVSGVSLNHYRIIFSGGSSLDVVSENVLISV